MIVSSRLILKATLIEYLNWMKRRKENINAINESHINRLQTTSRIFILKFKMKERKKAIKIFNLSKDICHKHIYKKKTVRLHNYLKILSERG